jgi:hypothetical protein
MKSALQSAGLLSIESYLIRIIDTESKQHVEVNLGITSKKGEIL